MPLYVPVLKARFGEMQAWAHADRRVVANARPVFDVGSDRGLDGLAAIGKYIWRHWPAGRSATLDVCDLAREHSGGVIGALTSISDELRMADIVVRPVVRTDSGPGLLDFALAVHEEHDVGIAVRLDLHPERRSDDAHRDLMGLLAKASIGPRSVDLLLDLGRVGGEGLALRSGQAASATRRAVEEGDWRSIAVVSGSFPETITKLPTGRYTPKRRFDADLWSKVIENQVLWFGDYGIAGPGVSKPVPRGPLPNLKYTHGEEWWVWRERGKAPGNGAMRILCNRVIRSEAWPATGVDFSWGDAEVARVARGEGGPGRGQEWIAWATSHHLAAVVDRLTTLGTA